MSSLPGFRCGNLLRTRLRWFPLRTSASAGSSRALPEYFNAPQATPPMKSKLQYRGVYAKSSGTPVMSQLPKVPSVDTLRCKIENIPGGLVDDMTDELLSLGALSARQAP